jgi:hypothetical protein
MTLLMPLPFTLGAFMAYGGQRRGQSGELTGHSVDAEAARIQLR